jgi:hypothetical protein
MRFRQPLVRLPKTLLMASSATLFLTVPIRGAIGTLTRTWVMRQALVTDTKER